MPKPAPTPEPKPLPKPPPVTPMDGNAVMLVCLEDPLMKPMLASDGGLQIVSLDAEASRKLKKSTILKWVNQGQLVKSNTKPPKSIPYDVTLTSFAYDFAAKSISTVKELIKKYGVKEVHGYEPFPAKSPEIHQFLFGSSNLLIPLFSRFFNRSD